MHGRCVVLVFMKKQKDITFLTLSLQLGISFYSKLHFSGYSISISPYKKKMLELSFDWDDHLLFSNCDLYEIKTQ